jgi:hypothetical protein
LRMIPSRTAKGSVTNVRWTSICDIHRLTTSI